METKTARFYLLYQENSDTTCHSEARFFKEKESARDAMRRDFDRHNRILNFPPVVEPGKEYEEEGYTLMSEDSISVLSGIDTYSWEIGEIVPED